MFITKTSENCVFKIRVYCDLHYFIKFPIKKNRNLSYSRGLKVFNVRQVFHFCTKSKNV